MPIPLIPQPPRGLGSASQKLQWASQRWLFLCFSCLFPLPAYPSIWLKCVNSSHKVLPGRLQAHAKRPVFTNSHPVSPLTNDQASRTESMKQSTLWRSTLEAWVSIKLTLVFLNTNMLWAIFSPNFFVFFGLSLEWKKSKSVLKGAWFVSERTFLSSIGFNIGMGWQRKRWVLLLCELMGIVMFNCRGKGTFWFLLTFLISFQRSNWKGRKEQAESMKKKSWFAKTGTIWARKWKTMVLDYNPKNKI